MKASRAERIKLHSNYLNGIAVAIFAIGGIGFLFQIIGRGDPLDVKSSIVYLGSALSSLVVHYYAQYKLRRLDED